MENDVLSVDKVFDYVFDVDWNFYDNELEFYFGIGASILGYLSPEAVFVALFGGGGGDVCVSAGKKTSIDRESKSDLVDISELILIYL